MKCIVCGKENDHYVCDECIKKENLRELCISLANATTSDPKYGPLIESGADLKWEVMRICSTLEYPNNKLIPLLAMSIHETYLSLNYVYSDRIKDVDKLLKCDDVSLEDKNILKTLKLSNCIRYSNYKNSEDIASDLLKQDNLMNTEIAVLMDYYCKTRRYNIVKDLYNQAISRNIVNKNIEDNYNSAIAREKGNVKEYMPSKTDKRIIYTNFMKELGINIDYTPSDKPDKDNEYPEVQFVDKMDFDSFVAYDIETTGFHGKQDFITEIGAVRVVNGKVVDSEEFKFQELVHQYGRGRNNDPKVIKLTGITKEMTDKAKKVDAVMSDFKDFIKDDILVGYNNKAFDSERLRRAGRYAHVVLENKQFDVMIPTKKYLREEYGLVEHKLSDAADAFGIVNPNAHRAYADALTTAKIYMEIYNKKNKK